VTTGEWDVRKLERVDETGGFVDVSGTRDGWLGANLYRVRLESSGIERLTREAGTHTVNVSPAGKLFLASRSPFDSPPKLTLCQGDGTPARVIDAGAPNKLAETYELGKHELVQIKMPDGFTLP